MVCGGLSFSHTPQVIFAGFSTGILFFQLPSTALYNFRLESNFGWRILLFSCLAVLLVVDRALVN